MDQGADVQLVSTMPEAVLIDGVRRSLSILGSFIVVPYCSSISSRTLDSVLQCPGGQRFRDKISHNLRLQISALAFSICQYPSAISDPYQRH